MKATTTQHDRDHHPIGLKDDRPDPNSRQIKQARECALTRMGDDLQVRTFRQPEPTV